MSPGEFFLDENGSNPVVLLSGGGGLTPMMSMLEAIVHPGSSRPTWYVHGAENGRVHAMLHNTGKLLRDLKRKRGAHSPGSFGVRACASGARIRKGNLSA